MAGLLLQKPLRPPGGRHLSLRMVTCSLKRPLPAANRRVEKLVAQVQFLEGAGNEG